MSNKFIGFLEAVGKDFLKGLTFVSKYIVPVGSLVALFFPPAAAVTAEVSVATSLIQKAVVLVEQKYSASGVQNGTGAQKSAEVLLLTEQAVVSLLAQAKINVDTTFVQNLINAVVAVMNVQAPPPSA